VRLSHIIKTDLLNSGFVPNATKCLWEPVQILEYLGCDSNTINGTISIPDRRLLKAQETIDFLIGLIDKKVKVVRKAASAVGQFISMTSHWPYISNYD
jgi:hypothetical protein